MPRATQKSDKYRNSDLAKIHIAKKELGLDDDTYREMLWNVARVRSSADLAPSARKDVLRHLESVGFERKTKGRPTNINRPDSRGAQLKKIEALLTIGGLPWAYADGIAKRMCKVDSIQWAPSNQLYKIITALVKKAEKEGWDLEK